MSSAPSRSDADVASALAGATEQLLTDIRALGSAAPVILIDGRSGAGKTSLADAVVLRWPLRGRVQVLALDSTYPGWDGMDEAVTDVGEHVLLPHSLGRAGTWRRWDWDAGSYAEAHAVDPELPLIVEGSGLLTPRTAALAPLRVWVDSPEPSRRERALARDGDTYRPHWERWARQEERHIDRDDPAALATRVVLVP